MILEIFYESISLTLFGTTLGKKLFGIKVTTEEGQYLSFSNSFIRTIKVWTVGLGLSIPYISFITRIIACVEYSRSGTMFWDKNRFKVYQMDNVNTSLSGLVVFIVIIFYMVTAIGTNMGDLSTIVTSTENKVDKLFNEGKYEEIITIYETDMDQSHITDDLYIMIGYSYMMVDDYQSAKKVFLQGVKVYSSGANLDTLYNNLSWACHELNEYDTALRFSELGLDLEPQDAVEYVNYGNALLALDREDDAFAAYEESLSYDENTKQALYGIGKIHYNNGDYEKAIDYFDKYIAIEEDSEVYCYLALSQLYLDNNVANVVDYLRKAGDIDPESAMVQDTWTTYYNYAGDYSSVIEIYEEKLIQDPENYDLLCKIAEAYYNNSNTDLSFEHIDKAISLMPEEPRAYTLKAKFHYLQNDYEKLDEIVNQMLAQTTNEADALLNAGRIYYNTEEYLKAAQYYEKSIAINDASEESYEGAVAALYYAKRYTRCKNTALEALTKFNNVNINYYLAYVYSKLNYPDTAINYYQKALNLTPDDVYLLTDIGWEYYYKQDYGEAAKWLMQALEQDSSNQRPNDLKAALAVKDQSLISQISEFIEDSYLYFKSTDNYNQTKERLLSKEDQTIDDVYELVRTVYNPDDLFTYILSGQDYKDYMEINEEKTVEYNQLDNNREYIRISSFMPRTSNEFLDIIENIDATEQKDLIIDLRDNYGGNTDSGCNILDFLLSDCVVCNLIDKSGYTNQYYSDASQIVFKNIYVLTNENSASCSELVALGLKTYLDNVTIIGKKTFCKGVGQFVYEDKNREFALFLVNHYWNVREVNIMDEGIEPDVYVSSNKLEDYLSVIQ
jgi:tetratricopeptide (TPR) repeat protein